MYALSRLLLCLHWNLYLITPSSFLFFLCFSFFYFSSRTPLFCVKSAGASSAAKQPYPELTGPKIHVVFSPLPRGTQWSMISVQSIFQRLQAVPSDAIPTLYLRVFFHRSFHAFLPPTPRFVAEAGLLEVIIIGPQKTECPVECLFHLII